MKGLPRSLSRGAQRLQETVRIDFTINSLVIAITGTTGVGWGTVVIGGLPVGHISLQNARLDYTITEASASIIDTFDGDISIGTTPTADGVLSGTEVDIIPSTATITAVSSVSSGNAFMTSTEVGTILDNSGGAQELNLNLLIDDASISGDDDVTIEGNLTLIYTVL